MRTVLVFVAFLSQLLLFAATGPIHGLEIAPATNDAPRLTPQQPQKTYDMGESLRVHGREIRMLRSLDKVAIISRSGEETQPAVAERMQVRDRTFRTERRVERLGTTVLRTSAVESSGEMLAVMREMAAQATAGRVMPVYIHGDSGLEMIPTGHIIVRLASGQTVTSLNAIGQRFGTAIRRPLRGTADQFILAAACETAEELFDLCLALENEPAIRWAEPDFIGQVVPCETRPNDPLFETDQWHLDDIGAPSAWDTTTGSEEVVIAIIDTGVDIDHEDLAANVFDSGDPINGLDDDGNGWVDDAHGWDFWADDADPRPADGTASHGTAVAGIAAATGNNEIGIAGSAFDCTLMPLPVLQNDNINTQDAYDAFIAAIPEALYYAAGRTQDGLGTWSAADVVSISLRFPETAVIADAIAYTAQSGRRGMGCPIFCSAGNDATGWANYSLTGFPASTYTFRWEYVKNASGSEQDDTVWLDSITWPGETTEPFEQTTLPAGWTTGGDLDWTNVQDGVNGDNAMTGWGGIGSRAVRAGTVGDGQRSYLEVTQSVDAGDLVFWIWPSSEPSLPVQVGTYSGRAWVDVPFTFQVPHVRMQSICPQQYISAGGAGTLNFVEFYLRTPPSRAIDRVVIRLKQISLTENAYSSAQWDNSEWTTVFEKSNVSVNTGHVYTAAAGPEHLVRFDFMAPFGYDPNLNLAIDISVSELTASDTTRCMLWNGQANRAVFGYGTMPTADPTQWTGSEGNATLLAYCPFMFFGSGDESRLFVNGLLYHRVSGVPEIEPAVSYPASDPNTIAVGSSTDLGFRADHSRYGPELDLVAPSGGGLRSITTTDQTGIGGYNFAGDYYSEFSGTSAAAPLAAGVAALMLSINPDLTAQELRTIVHQTCAKIGSLPYDTAGRNDYYGFGRVDAEAAVNGASGSSISIGLE